MNNMKCVDCALKHLAAAIAFYKELKTFEPENYDHTARILQHVALAISYAKEIMNGHNQENPLDHRPDMLGEIIIVETLIPNSDIKKSFSEMRKKLQASAMTPTQDNVIELQQFYKMLRGKKPSQPDVSEADFLGEIMNAEHHLYLISPGVAFAIGTLRSMFQHDSEPSNMAEVLRNHWQNIDKENYPPAEILEKKQNIKGNCRSCGRKKFKS